MGLLDLDYIFQSEEGDKELINSRFSTPVALTPTFVENLKEVKYPILENLSSLRVGSSTSALSSESDDLHSTPHGVSVIVPSPGSDAEESRRSHDIDRWLNGIVEATTIGRSRSPKQCYDTENLLMNDAPLSRSIAPNISSQIRPQVSPLKLKQDLLSPSGASTNKENVSPSKVSSSPTRPPAHYPQISTPSYFDQANTQPGLQYTKAVHFAHPVTPQDHLRLLPKRKKARIAGIPSSRAETETARRDLTIREDQLVSALAQLSPDVEAHRKGRGPKRERCVSYWDEDILPPAPQRVAMKFDDVVDNMGKGDQVLGE